MLLLLFSIMLCHYSYGATGISGECASLRNRATYERFELVFDWYYINFTWPTGDIYQKAVESKLYIPENNAICGVKYYDDRFYFALPKAKEGAPVTLASLSADTDLQLNPLLTPYPNWQKNVGASCDNLKNVQSMDIDRKGIMWVLDGRRIDKIIEKCPPKIILLDLNRNGRVIQTYIVPGHVCSASNCFLNDIVIDEIDGGYAYITDTSSDPGLIVYSRKLNRAWKARDKTMHAQPEAANFIVNGFAHRHLTPIDGIALEPRDTLDDFDRLVYYTALTGLNLYAINSSVLRNERLATSSKLKDYVINFGEKLSPSDGMIMDAEGELYYGLLSTNSVSEWNSKRALNTSEIIDNNSDLIIWPDSFAFDQTGNLYLISNNMDYFLKYDISNNNSNFRLLKYHTGTCSYQF